MTFQLRNGQSFHACDMPAGEGVTIMGSEANSRPEKDKPAE